MNRFILTATFLLFIVINGYSQSNNDALKLTLQIQHYYLNPDPASLPKLIQMADNAGILPKRELSTLAFLSTAMSLARADSLSYLEAIHNTSSANKTFFQDCYRISSNVDPILNWPEHSARANDMMWAAFFASGDKRYLKRLVSEMRHCNEKDSVLIYVTGATAQWSLCANAKSDPKIAEYLNDIQKEVSPDLKILLKEALDGNPADFRMRMNETILQFKKDNTTTNSSNIMTSKAQIDFDQNGLRGMFCLIDNKRFFDEWQKPDTPKISPVDTYKRGQDVFPIIIFSTDGKDSKGNADLSYDITIKKPDGSIYGHFEQLTIWKDAPAPTMHLVQQPINIRIEQSDPFGLYKVDIVIHENCKKIALPLHLAFLVQE